MIVHWHLDHHVCLAQKKKPFQRGWSSILEVRRPKMILRSDLTLLFVKNELLHRLGVDCLGIPAATKPYESGSSKIHQNTMQNDSSVSLGSPRVSNPEERTVSTLFDQYLGSQAPENDSAK